MRILGVIPARGGSKRVYKKNIRPLLEKPLIAWTIEAARLGLPGRTIVSTDDPEIAEIAKAAGGEVPFVRPEQLATDTSGIEGVLRHAYEWMRDHEEYEADAIALLLPTNPTRQPFHLREAVERMTATSADSVVAVVPALANMNPAWILKRDADGRVCLHDGEPLTKILTRSQDLPPRFSRNDLVYLLKPANLYQATPNLYGDHVELLETDDFFTADINTENDWFMTEQKMRLLRDGKVPGGSLPQ